MIVQFVPRIELARRKRIFRFYQRGSRVFAGPTQVLVKPGGIRRPPRHASLARPFDQATEANHSLAAGF